MSADGSGRSKLNDENSRHLNVINGWIYYVNDDDNSKIYRIRIDGSERALLSNDGTQALNIEGGWVYYSILDDAGIYRMRVDGSNRTLLTDRFSSVYWISIVNDWVYFHTGGGMIQCHRMRTDGSELVENVFWRERNDTGRFSYLIPQNFVHLILVQASNRSDYPD